MSAVHAAPVASAAATVVSLNPDEPIDPKPLIADMLRTRYCIPGSIFLVESAESRIPVSRKYRTIRVLLGDGELCVQALLHPGIHCFVDGGQIYEGCYVRVDKVELRQIEVAGGPRKVLYLLVRDMITVGWNNAYLEMLGVRPRTAVGHGLVDSVPESKHDKGLAKDVNYMSSSDDAFETMDVSEEKVAQRRTHSKPPLPWMANDPTQPLRLTPLRSIPNLPYKQNWMVNVLAVVASLSDVEPSHLPPYTQRTARLVDPSTPKQVLLTVFLEPESFFPAVGSVVLLVGIKNHRFDGGSLKKYVSDKPKNGASWWVENPSKLGWCEAEAVGLKTWWDAVVAKSDVA
ncbi:hypothetical protein B0T24DRAFT_539897 [Lasiosphaeria ovina]|uniref:Cyclin-like F-box n=1 Tax=Lasiosphaeria ovina TaxID=92902 RepID=A0AAE0MXV0_9PEZI|nr:hypothetical protein B0T24DRAFT_539897 [Lasiosphaeria ovina]